MKNYVSFLKKIMDNKNKLLELKVPLKIISSKKFDINKDSEIYIANTGKDVSLSSLAHAFLILPQRILDLIDELKLPFGVTKTHEDYFICLDVYAHYVADTYNLNSKPITTHY